MSIVARQSVVYHVLPTTLKAMLVATHERRTANRKLVCNKESQRRENPDLSSLVPTAVYLCSLRY